MVADIPPQEELDWVKLRSDMDDAMLVDSMLDKTMRRFKENPFVPIGCTATVAALSYGIYSFWRGRSQMSQYMMRARIVAQGATIVAILCSLGTAVPKKQ